MAVVSPVTTGEIQNPLNHNGMTLKVVRLEGITDDGGDGATFDNPSPHTPQDWAVKVDATGAFPAGISGTYRAATDDFFFRVDGATGPANVYLYIWY